MLWVKLEIVTIDFSYLLTKIAIIDIVFKSENVLSFTTYTLINKTNTIYQIVPPFDVADDVVFGGGSIITIKF